MIDEKLPSLRSIVGLADACELLAAATAFPEEDLANALSDGRLVSDARSCLGDCGAAPDEVAVACEPWEGLVGEDCGLLLPDLKRTYSLLFLRQGNGVAVWPYEAAFLHVKAGKEGEPALFRSPIALAVEQAMREAGVLPRDSRVEPCDSIWDEFVFLSYLFGSEAEALDTDDGEAAALFRNRARAFADGHALRWLPDFFEAVGRKLPEATKPESASFRFYQGLCSYGAYVTGLLSLPASEG